jgi:hypothetical protein
MLGLRWDGGLNHEDATAVAAHLTVGIRVVDLSTELLVPGVVRDGFLTIDGTAAHTGEPETGWGTGFSFVPDAEMNEGWYVLTADVAALRDHHLTSFGRHLFVDNDQVFIRVYIGSQVVWTRTLVTCFPGVEEPGRCEVIVLTSEAAPHLEMTVEIDGLASCTPTTGGRWNCPLAPEGSVVRLHLLGGAVLPSGSSTGEQLVTIGAQGESDELVEPFFGVAAARSVL